jgi:hypothetical protein
MIRYPLVALTAWMLLFLAGCSTSTPTTPSTPPDVSTASDTLHGSDGTHVTDVVQGADVSNPQDDALVVPDAGVEEPEKYTRVTWRRLNRAEYNNTVRDLLGTEQRPADDFPDDDTGYGFDNIASVLSLSPLHLELYERAARELAKEVTKIPVAEPELILYEAEGPNVQGSTGKASGTSYNLWSNGDLTGLFAIPTDGTYLLQARVWGQQAGADPVKVSFVVEGLSQNVIDVPNAADDPLIVEMTVQLNEGSRMVGIEFLNDFYDPDAGLDRNLIIDWISVEGPMDAPDPADSSYAKLFDQCTPAEGGDGQGKCATQILGNLAKRAWRQPVSEAQVSDLLSLAQIGWDEGETFEGGMELPITAILLSPRFIFKTEYNDLPASSEAEALNDYEIATRLSYLLWSSMPDEALFAAAEAGLLQQGDELEKQVIRMLDDPKAMALRNNFAEQWLYIRDIDNIFPDTWAYPNFDEELRSAMKEEMLRFFESFVFDDRSMMELLTAKETVMNHRLAEHYGVEGIAEEDGWVTVDLSGTKRKGLLTQAGLLSVLSTPFRTSIVRRGKWVLEQLLCEAPPPPPPGVEGNLEQAEGDDPKTLREMMEQHASDPECVACHMLMDPIGFGLENFDGIGGWRDLDNGFPIDASGELPGGQTFEDSTGLIDLLSQDTRLTECMVEKTFIYALGRGIKKEDLDSLDAIEGSFIEGNHRFEELLIHIVRSDAFRFRTGEPATEESP